MTPMDLLVMAYPYPTSEPVRAVRLVLSGVAGAYDRLRTLREVLQRTHGVAELALPWDAAWIEHFRPDWWWPDGSDDQDEWFGRGWMPTPATFVLADRDRVRLPCGRMLVSASGLTWTADDYERSAYVRSHTLVWEDLERARRACLGLKEPEDE